MIYLLLIFLFKPFLYALSFVRQPKSGSLVVQSAKIGDYVNTTVMFEALGSCDVVIDSVNVELAKNDARIEHIWLLDAYKRSLAGRLALGVDIFFRGYETIYVATPNNLNLFLAIMGHTKISTFTHYKTGQTAKLLLRFCNKVGAHTKDDLTIDTYLGLIDDKLNHTTTHKKAIVYKNEPTLELSFDDNIKKVGVALSAGNKIKELGDKEWKKLFAILDEYECEIHVFGVHFEERILERLMDGLELKNARIVSHLGELHLDLLPLAISKMSLFIASDTAGVYIADSLNIPTIVYAGPCHMKEQRPLGEKVLIVESNAPCAPFSFIFNAPYHKKCEGLYDTTPSQEEEIKSFINFILGQKL